MYARAGKTLVCGKDRSPGARLLNEAMRRRKHQAGVRWMQKNSCRCLQRHDTSELRNAQDGAGDCPAYAWRFGNRPKKLQRCNSDRTLAERVAAQLALEYCANDSAAVLSPHDLPVDFFSTFCGSDPRGPDRILAFKHHSQPLADPAHA